MTNETPERAGHGRQQLQERLDEALDERDVARRQRDDALEEVYRLDRQLATLHELRAKLANAEQERDGLREVVAERAAVNQQLGVEPQRASAWPLVVAWSAMVAMAVLAIWWAAS